MRLTIRHKFDFGTDRELVGSNLVRPDAWDALRTQTDGPFALPADAAEWERAARSHDELRDRAQSIDTTLDGLGAESLVSYGAGVALLEYWLDQISPERRLTITDYAPETVRRLADVFPAAEVRQHDLLADPPIGEDVCLFHRIDTELTNREWRDVFRRFAGRTIVVVATEVIDLRRGIAELRARKHRRTASDAGLIRNRAAFEALWKPTHTGDREMFSDLHGWVLTPRG